MAISRIRWRHQPPYKPAGFVLVVAISVVLALVWFQFRGDFTPKTQLTLVASRAGLVADPGSKVTYNGVPIGRVAKINEVTVGGQPRAKLTLNVDPKYIDLIPANVATNITGSASPSITATRSWRT